MARFVVPCLILGLVVSGCQEDDRPRTDAETCEGHGVITLVEGRREMGELLCNGVCPNGNRCTPQANADNTRQWCGCPGEDEPAGCHLAKIQLEGGGWAFDCDGPCPVDVDMCAPRARRDGERLLISCECVVPEPA